MQLFYSYLGIFFAFSVTFRDQTRVSVMLVTDYLVGGVLNMNAIVESSYIAA